MSKLCIEGDTPLFGEVEIQGSKNSILPLLSAALLCKGICRFYHVPEIQDVYASIDILNYLGAKVTFENHRLEVDSTTLIRSSIPETYMKKMRSSVLFMSSLLVRLGKVEATKPGGCLIGKRPIDYHLQVFEAFGSVVELKEESILVRTKELIPTVIELKFPSVGATENALIVAAGIEGTSVIKGVAREPEVLELCWFLEEMGASIEHIGESVLVVHGLKKLNGVCYTVSSDRIVAGTYLSACMSIGGRICLRNAPIPFMNPILQLFASMGAEYKAYEDTLFFTMKKRPVAIPYLETAPYPGFSTDMQSIVMAMLARADGVSVIKETIFESRMEMIPYLRKMGATIFQEGNQAVIYGINQLTGCKVSATDLRSGAALAVAGVGAKGLTVIDHYAYLSRGYENIAKDLVQLGGKAWIAS
ncbi:UDP-N-acetylglucosamine 1-carboxyvinyltransferase [Lachnospiraceae bacterium TWA4]|nr:UDP-N-acetylglucosamine 1-carboxyvinyltransferase [Lachnospiraceae bacterium TWA4]